MSRGTKLGRYTLIEQLAIGGMAEIWLAHMAGPEGFEKLLVIKKILSNLSQRPDFLKMFLNEARLAAQLNHPNIVQIYDLGKLDETYFIAMEYIFGRDLSEIGFKAKQKNNPVPIEYATKIISQVCEGLYFAHTKSDTLGNPLHIVHRDISPHNVLVSFAGNVKILDFGIAKAANQYDQTQQGILKGKVSYMSPEQIWGDPIDERSDLFGLGAVYYELLTGYRLFTGENDIAILRKITEEEVPPPSIHNKKVPPDLDAIILNMLSKDPQTRYPNAWELQQDLNLLLKRLGSPTNMHMAQYLRQLFDDEMDAERVYLQKKIEELVHAEVLPPIEEEETLVVFAGSRELEQVDQESNGQEPEELPVVVGKSVQSVPNPWLDPMDDTNDEPAEADWSRESLELSLPTSEAHAQHPIQDQPSIRIVAESTNPEMRVKQPVQAIPAQSRENSHPSLGGAPVRGSRYTSTPTPQPAVVPNQERTAEHAPSHGSHQASPLFSTIQQLDHVQPMSNPAPAFPPNGQRQTSDPRAVSASHAEAHRHASYINHASHPNHSSMFSGTSGSSMSPPLQGQSTGNMFSIQTPRSPFAKNPAFSPSTVSQVSGSLFVPLTSQPRRNGDIPLVLSLSPQEYHQLSLVAQQHELSVVQVAHHMILQALASWKAREP